MKKVTNLLSVFVLCMVLTSSYPSVAQNSDSTARTQSTRTTESGEDREDHGKWGLAGLLGLLGLLGLRKKNDVVVSNRTTSPQGRS